MLPIYAVGMKVPRYNTGIVYSWWRDRGDKKVQTPDPDPTKEP
jgi:hypothetical protein